MNKQIFRIGIVLAVFAVLVATAAADENTEWLEPSDISAEPGETVCVELWTETYEGVYSYQTEILFDKGVVEIISATSGDFYNTFLWNNLGDGRFRVTGTNDLLDDKPAGTYLLANLTLEAQNPGTSVLNFSGETKFTQWNPVPPHAVPVTVTNGTFTCTGSVPEETFSKSLVTGWNMISLPLTAADMSVANVINSSLSGSYDELYEYDASAHNYVALSSTDTMQNGVGYFIHMTSVGTWTYTGSAYTSMTVDLSQGLNMVGWLNCTKEDISDALSSIEGGYWYAARWNAEEQKFVVYNSQAPNGFNDFSDMERGTGYFISAKADDTTLSESC